MALTSAKIWRPKWYRRSGWRLAAFGLFSGLALGTAITHPVRLPGLGSVGLSSPTPAMVGRGGEVSPPAVIRRAETFGRCSSAPSSNCVIDGDTFRYRGEKIRIADIDAPETGGAKCRAEAQLGARATDRLAALLSSGAFDLTAYDSRDRDQFGRLLRVVERDGVSIGQILVAEGLARRWEGRRRPWC